MSRNLSEVLFSKKHNEPETSTLIKSHESKQNKKRHHKQASAHHNVGWYRLLKLMQWSWQGISIVDSYEVLSHISASKHPRSDEHLLDTVIGFRPGNWCYEWSKKGMAYQKIGREAVAHGDKKAAKKAYFTASQYYSVASYPHLKGDENSIKAQTLAFASYRDAFVHDESALLKEINVPFEGKSITCYLHLPHDETILPAVIVSAGIDGLQCDLLSLFEEHFKPAGVAMLTVDMPGVGLSNHLKLTQDTSQLHQAVLRHMQNVPWVDHARVGLMGLGMGGNSMLRLAYLEPQLVSGVVSVGPAIASVFDKTEQFTKLAPMTLDCFANRMQMNRSDATYLYQHCLPFSLTKQGLMARKRVKVPMLGIGNINDIMCNEQDLTLIKNASSSSEATIIRKSPVFASYLQALTHATHWLTQYLRE